MVTQRKPTVLTPKPPPKPRAKSSKATPAQRREWKPTPGQEIRVRVTAEQPEGFLRPVYLSDDFDAEMLAADNEAAGLPSVIEYASQFGYMPQSPPPVMVADLAADHLARQHGDGKWEILPEGWQRIAASLRGR